MEQVYDLSPGKDQSCDITLGKVPGQFWWPVGGRSPNMIADIEETIWDQGGIYDYLSADTTLYVSSSDVGDTDVDLTIFGMTDDFVEVVRTVNTNGQNQVPITGDLFRIFFIVVSGAIAPLGDLYIAESDSLTGGVPDTAAKIKAKIIQGKNATHMANITIPAGHIGIITTAVYSAGKGDEIIFRPITRPNGGVFASNSEFPVYQSSPEFKLNGVSFPAGTDIEVRGKADNTGAIGSAFYDVKMVALSSLN